MAPEIYISPRVNKNDGDDEILIAKTSDEDGIYETELGGKVRIENNPRELRGAKGIAVTTNEFSKYCKHKKRFDVRQYIRLDEEGCGEVAISSEDKIVIKPLKK